MYFEDLSRYSYYLSVPISNVWNVGWISSAHTYAKGDVSDHFVRKLTALVSGTSHIDIHVNRIRGIHPCELCGDDAIKIEDWQGRPQFLGMSELWIPTKDTYYAAPSMVLHYIEAHCYKPPQDFVDAVEQMSVSAEYNAQRTYDQLMRDHLANA